MNIEIEKNVPFPVKFGSKVEFADKMEIGDSFVVPKKQRPYVLSQLKKRHMALKTGFRFTSANINDEESRIWRSK